MNVFVCVLILQVLESASAICDSTSSDVCKLYNNQELPHVYTRHPSIDYSALTDDTKYCDLHALKHDTWYRSSYNLVTYCVDHRKCGTSDPIWLNGTLPSDTDGTVDGTGCVRTFGQCCEHTLMLKIRNCTYYMVYCFVGIHPSCHSRYCLDTDLSIETTTTTTTTTDCGTTTTTTTTDSSTPIQESNLKCDTCTVYIILVVIFVLLSTLCAVGIAYLLKTRTPTTSTKIGASVTSLLSNPRRRPITAMSVGTISIGINNSSDEYHNDVKS